MTLKEKFNPYCDNLFSSKEVNAENCVDVADDYAIEFSEWCASKYMKLHSVWCPIFGDQRNKDNWKTTKDLLEQFKKEKGYDS
jgi:hypothetical protein